MKEFEELNIPTARSLKADPTKKSEYIDPRTGKLVNIAKKSEDALSKTAISAAKTKAIAKITLLAKFLSMNESVTSLKLPILEGLDNIDRRLLAETAYKLVASLQRSVNEELDKDGKTFANKFEHNIQAILTMPSTQAAAAVAERDHLFKDTMIEGRELSIRFNSSDIAIINMNLAAICEDFGFRPDQYLFTIGRVKKGKYTGNLGHTVLKNAIV